MKITYLNGPNAGTRCEIGPDGASIGRETDNSLQLLMGGVSRYHARIEWEDGIWKLQDLGSTNGTTLNGSKITGAEKLHNGDIFGIGEQQFRVEECLNADTETSGKNAQGFSFHFDGDTQLGDNATPSATINATPANSGATQSSNESKEILNAFGNTSEDKTEQQSVHAYPDSETQSVGSEVSFDNLFGQKDNGPKTLQGNEKSPQEKRKKLIGNIIFAVALLLLIIGGIVGFLYIKGNGGETQKTVAAKQYKNPFCFYYERQVVTTEGTPNVYKVSVSGEFGYATGDLEKGADGTMKPKKRFFVKYTLDDLAANRHVVRTVGDKTCPIEIDTIKNLNDKLSNFVKANETNKGDTQTINATNYERFVVCDGDAGNMVDVISLGAQNFNQDFENAKRALNNFLDEIAPETPLSIKTTEETLKIARDNYAEGKKYGEVLERPQDLKDALYKFQKAVWYYGQFTLTTNSEDFKKYEDAKERYAKLQAELNEKYDILYGNARSEQSKGNYDRALEICNEAMKYLIDGTPKYKEIYELRQKIEERRNKAREK